MPTSISAKSSATRQRNNMSKNAKQIIRELVEEVIEEMTSTGAVAGYQTPNAFGKNPAKKRDAARSMPGGEVVGDIDTDSTTVGEGERLTIRRGLEEGVKPLYDVQIYLPNRRELEAEVTTSKTTPATAIADVKEFLLGNPDMMELHGRLYDKTGLLKDDLIFKVVKSAESLHEGRSRYRNFKESDVMRNHGKISYGINQAKKMLGEVEYLLNICERLKTECDIPTTNLWKRTQPDMKEIHRRLKEIANRIHKLGK